LLLLVQLLPLLCTLAGSHVILKLPQLQGGAAGQVHFHIVLALDKGIEHTNKQPDS
jgi:hypothetical protein